MNAALKFHVIGIGLIGCPYRTRQMINRIVEIDCPKCGEGWLLSVTETRDELKPWMGDFEIDPSACDCGHEFTEAEISEKI